MDGRWVESPEEITVLQINLLRAYGYSENLVELHVHPAQFSMQVSKYPAASPLARFQAQGDEPLTNLRHERVDLDGAGRFLLAHLDGSRSTADLIRLLEGAIREGVVHIAPDAGNADDLTTLSPAPLDMMPAVETRLAHFARSALLTGWTIWDR